LFAGGAGSIRQELYLLGDSLAEPPELLLVKVLRRLYHSSEEIIPHERREGGAPPQA